ncbi:queuosine precursor transporter [Flammeovirga agarivorans]|uniref:Probable queuosine precursor transporter n=2 Tax=Flammeovirga TaxID=59739 RepID=A0A7X8SH39_9BACT|nr:queuosine precursor transporter [Flammeovirga agarivorans]NLR90150.1 queuosine precursor transporter [Flammeovirga agarivorans]
MDRSQLINERKRQTLYVALCAIFLTNAIVAELVGPKIFSLEAFMGIAPAQLKIMDGFVLDFNLTAGVVLWPVVFITTDIINEYFGKRGVKKISFITAGLITYVFVVVFFVTKLPPAQFWLDLNSTDSAGNPFNIEEAFDKIFTQGMGIIIGSLVAFLIGQFLDAHTFQWLRKLTGSKQIWVRATGSTLISQLVDSFVVLGVAFYVFGNWPLKQVLAVGIINYIYKFIIAVGMTPLLYVSHYVIDSYLGKDFAEQVVEDAAKTNLFEKNSD